MLDRTAWKARPFSARPDKLLSSFLMAFTWSLSFWSAQRASCVSGGFLGVFPLTLDTSGAGPCTPGHRSAAIPVEVVGRQGPLVPGLVVALLQLRYQIDHRATPGRGRLRNAVEQLDHPSVHVPVDPPLVLEGPVLATGVEDAPGPTLRILWDDIGHALARAGKLEDGRRVQSAARRRSAAGDDGARRRRRRGSGGRRCPSPSL